MNPELSVVIPIRNESPNIEALYVEITEALERWGRSYEVLAIDDGSTDDSFDRLARCQQRDPRWRIIRFRRNFGQTAAFAAGFRYARGRVIATSDGDLQNDPRDPARHDPPHRGRLRHRLRLAEGAQGRVADAPAALGDGQQADLVVDRRQAARLRMLAQGVSIGGRQADQALRRNASISTGDRQRDGRKIAEVVVNHRARKHGAFEVRALADVSRHPGSADGQVSAELLDASAADVRSYRRADGPAGLRSLPPISHTSACSATNRSPTDRCCCSRCC